MSAEFAAREYSVFLTYLADPALRSLAIGCFAAVALAAFRVQRVAARLLVWTAVLCAALAMPFLGAFLPRVQLPVPAAPLVQSLQASFKRGPARTLQHEVAAANSMPPRARGVVRRSATPGAALRKIRFAAHKAVRKPNDELAMASFDSGADRVPANVPPPPATITTTAAAPIATASQRRLLIPWAGILLGIYLAGAAILFVRLFVGVWFSKRLERAAENIDDREAMRLLRFRACIAGLRDAPRMKQSAMLAVPATVGVRRAAILLPTDWRTWTAEQLDAILAHEISHVARRDALTQLLSLVHRMIFWFSPLSWWLDRQLTDLAEQASDEAALAGGADRTRYAETLLGFFAQLGAAPGRVWWQGVSMAKVAKAGRAERRVDRILAWRGAISMKKPFAVALIALVAPIVFLAASVHPFLAHAQDQPQPPAQNQLRPGGPVAPALPAAPKAPCVEAPALAPTPQSGVTAPAKMRPPTPAAMLLPPNPATAPIALGPIAPAELATSFAPPALMPLPAALARPRIAPGLLAGVMPPDAPAALAGPMIPIALATPVRLVAQSESVAPAAPAATPGAAQSYNYAGYGSRYVIMSGNSDEVSMSGSDEDLDHARELRKKISGDFIWFERDEKSYVITDQGFIARAKALFAPEEALAKQQDELGREQDALGKQQDALGQQMDSVKVKPRDITPDLERIRAELEAMRHDNGATQSELGRLQAELGTLQSQIGRYQSEGGSQQSDIGRQQGDLGRQQGELGRRQGELGRQQGELARKASQQLREMLDEAITKGIAKPEQL